MVARMVYTDGLRLVMMKAPSGPDVVVLSSPVRWFLTVMVAPPTNAPVLSRTVPAKRA